jgi:hypothetical protein
MRRILRRPDSETVDAKRETSEQMAGTAGVGGGIGSAPVGVVRLGAALT